MKGRERSETAAAFSQDQAWQRSSANLQMGFPQVGLLHFGLTMNTRRMRQKLPQYQYKTHAEAQLTMSKIFYEVTYFLIRQTMFFVAKL